MGGKKIQARHVFQSAICPDLSLYWRSSTREPCFIWGGETKGSLERIGRVQSAFRKWIEENGCDEALTFYHDGGGADFLSPLDPARHKVLLFNRWPLRWERYLDWHLRYTGRVAVANSALKKAVCDHFRWIPSRFVHTYPSLPMGLSATDGRQKIQKTLVWMHGQNWKTKGSRLRALVDRWVTSGERLMVISLGGKVPKWAQRTEVEWVGDMSIAEATRKASACDSLFLFNDFELDAPWLRNFLAAGLFPLVPDGDSPCHTGNWLKANAPQSYAWGDYSGALILLQSWREASASDGAYFKAWVAEVVGADGNCSFEVDWEQFKQAIVEQNAPRLRDWKTRGKLALTSWYERVDRLRRGE